MIVVITVISITIEVPSILVVKFTVTSCISRNRNQKIVCCEGNVIRKCWLVGVCCSSKHSLLVSLLPVRAAMEARGAGRALCSERLGGGAR